MSDTTGSMPPSVQPTGQVPATGTTPPARVSSRSTMAGADATGSAPALSDTPLSESAVETTVKPAAAADSATKIRKPKPPGPRRVRLTVSRVDPWSVMKLAFLLSIAVGIGYVVATATVWTVLNQQGVFSSIRELITEVGAMNQFGPLLEYLEFSRVLSVSVVIGGANIILMTALWTLGAFIYNMVAAMVGGLHLTLTDD